MHFCLPWQTAHGVCEIHRPIDPFTDGEQMEERIEVQSGNEPPVAMSRDGQSRSKYARPARMRIGTK